MVIGRCRNGLCINAKAKCVHRVAWPRNPKKRVAMLGGATLVPVHYLIEIFCVFASFLEADLLHLPAGLGCVTRSWSIRCYFCFYWRKRNWKHRWSENDLSNNRRDRATIHDMHKLWNMNDSNAWRLPAPPRPVLMVGLYVWESRSWRRSINGRSRPVFSVFEGCFWGKPFSYLRRKCFFETIEITQSKIVTLVSPHDRNILRIHRR